MAKANSKLRSYEPKDNQLELALTTVEYSGLERAKHFFNVELFDGSLPDIFITYQRKANSVGSFASDEFAGRIGDFNRDGIRLNPDTFVGQTDAQILKNLPNGAWLAKAPRQAIRARLCQP